MTQFDDGPAESGLTFVGAPLEVTRTADTRFVGQARANFAEYVHKTPQASLSVGGRYNAPGAFGALYRASDEATAWAEIAARYRREGVPGLPPAMGVLRILITDGRYADLTDPGAAAAWEVDGDALRADAPTEAQRAKCHRVGAAVRAVADFLMAPSHGHHALRGRPGDFGTFGTRPAWVCETTVAEPDEMPASLSSGFRPAPVGLGPSDLA